MTRRSKRSLSVLLVLGIATSLHLSSPPIASACPAGSFVCDSADETCPPLDDMEALCLESDPGCSRLPDSIQCYDAGSDEAQQFCGVQDSAFLICNWNH